MLDFKLLTACDHRVQEIIEINGTSPNFYSDLFYTSNSNKQTTYIHELVESDGLTLFGLTNNGITNYSFTEGGKRLTFGVTEVDAGTLFPDPNPSYIPQKKYFCTYSSLRTECPKCIGSGNTKDIHFDNTQRLVVLEGHAKVRQQIWKALLTLRSSNSFNKAYGSSLSELIGQRVDAYLAAKLQFSVLECLEELIAIQRSMDLPDNERIASVSSVDIKKNDTDPRILEMVVTVLCSDYEEVSTSIQLGF